MIVAAGRPRPDTSPTTNKTLAVVELHHVVPVAADVDVGDAGDVRARRR